MVLPPAILVVLQLEHQFLALFFVVLYCSLRIVTETTESFIFVVVVQEQLKSFLQDAKNAIESNATPATIKALFIFTDLTLK